MALSLGILFGIIAMLCWGVADFFVAKAVRKADVLKTFIWTQITGLILFLVIFSLFFKFPIVSFNTLIIVLIAGFLGVIPLLAYYKGLQIGAVSIISPIAASYAAVAVILSLVFLNETLTILQTIGIILAISGAILASFKLHNLAKLRLKNFATGIKYAIIAMLGWGMLVVLISILVSELGWFMPIFLVKMLIVLYALSYAGITKKNISFPKNALLLIILIGFLESGGFLAFGAGISLEYTAIIAPVSSVYPAITIILAQIFFKEIVETNQKVGIAAVLIGLVLLSI